MTYLAGLIHALVSPVNCVAELVNGLTQVGGHFVQCVGNNLIGVSSAVTNLPI